MAILAEKRTSLRQAVNDHCRSCIYDSKARGSWRQQTTLCSVTECNLHPVRPTTKSPIPNRVLDYYSITGPERDCYGLKNPRKGRFVEHKGVDPCPAIPPHDALAS